MTQSCADIREAVRSGKVAPGGVASDGATRAHLETCPACAALVAADPLLKAWNAGEAEAAPSFEWVRARLEEEAASPAGRLRARSTRLRIALALMATALIVGPTLWMGERGSGTSGGGFAAYPVERTLSFIVALSIALGVTITGALRPAHRPGLTPGVARGTIAAAVLLELILSALPDVPRANTPRGALFALAMPCFYTGLLFGIPVYGVLRVLDHGVTRLATLLAACSAGLTANLALHLHCPITHPEHVLLGHFTVALAFLGAVASASRWMTRRRPAAKTSLDKEIKTP